MKRPPPKKTYVPIFSPIIGFGTNEKFTSNLWACHCHGDLDFYQFMVILFQICYAEWKDHPNKPLLASFQSHRAIGFGNNDKFTFNLWACLVLVAMETWICTNLWRFYFKLVMLSGKTTQTNPYGPIFSPIGLWVFR